GVGHAELPADLDVVRPFVRRAGQAPDHQDGELAQARVELALEADETAEPAEGPQSVWAVRQRTEDVGIARQQVLVVRRQVLLVEIGTTRHRPWPPSTCSGCRAGELSVTPPSTTSTCPVM